MTAHARDIHLVEKIHYFYFHAAKVVENEYFIR